MRQTLLIGCIISLCVLTGCRSEAGTPVKPDIAENEPSPAVVVDDAILDGMQAQAASHEALAAVSTAPTPLELEDVFYQLTGSRPDASFHRSEFSYPSGEGSSCTLWKGQEPAYEQFLNVEIINMETRFFYSAERYDYIEAVFDPKEDIPELECGELSFKEPGAVTDEFRDAAASLGIELVDIACYSMSAEALQSLYDRRLETGTLRDKRYANPSSTFKDQSYAAQRPQWTADDECYYLTGQPCLFGVPVFGTEISACLDRTGWIWFFAMGLTDTDPQEPKPTASVDTVLAAVDRIAARLHSVDTPVLQNASLYYYAIAQNHFVPAWRMEIGYTFTNADGITEQRTAVVWIHACYGNELPEVNS